VLKPRLWKVCDNAFVPVTIMLHDSSRAAHALKSSEQKYDAALVLP
jgi:hypothetical protein